MDQIAFGRSYSKGNATRRVPGRTLWLGARHEMTRTPMMPSRRHDRAAAAALAVGLTLAATPSAAESGLFTGLSGAWSGGGTLTTSDGQTERLRCRATYAVQAAGDQLQQTLRCASDTYRFDISSNVESNGGGAISGTWNESTRNVRGNLAGRARGGQIQAKVEAAGFSASLAVNTQGERQSVAIRSPGHELESVAVTLNKSK